MPGYDQSRNNKSEKLQFGNGNAIAFVFYFCAWTFCIEQDIE